MNTNMYIYICIFMKNMLIICEHVHMQKHMCGNIQTICEDLGAI